MLRIQQQTMAALGQQQRARFEARLARTVAQSYPDAKEMSAEAIAARVHALVVKAEALGFASERDIGVVVGAGWVLGDEFDREHAGAREVLATPDLTISERCAALHLVADLALAELGPPGES
ncbi:MAG: hypothetical protein HY744_32250 [Deltaproteobacteria bacterium]|nr:hypothetical protein [Deltaproteobacteria bacterium]